MNIITPIKITDSTLVSSSVSEDNTPVWISGTYAVGTERHVVSTHRVYRCAMAGVSSISPESDPTRWTDIRPTNKWAPFDYYTSTKATSVTTITYVLTPGYFNSIALYGLVGSSYSITVKDNTGGSIIFSKTGLLVSDPIGWYEYLFNSTFILDKLIVKDIPIRPLAEITITITTATGQPVGIGAIIVGDYISLTGTSNEGGTQYGASAEPVTYSYIKTYDDGTTSIIKRHSATNLRGSVIIAQVEADIALQILQSVLDVPVAVILSNVPNYAGLTTFGLIQSSPVSYDNPSFVKIDFNVKGII